MKPGNVAAALVKGMVAGAIGTAAMSVSSGLEVKLRPGGTRIPRGVQAATNVAGREYTDLVCWTYGISWGAVRALLGGLGLTRPAARASHFASVWGAELVVLPPLSMGPPVRKWGATELTFDGLHHLVYALTTDLAYARLRQ